jgi:sRNA-binding protein
VVQKALIDGRVYFDREKDIANRAEIEKEKKALTEKLKKAEKKSEDKKPEGKKPEEKPKPPTPTPTPTTAVVSQGGAL